MQLNLERPDYPFFLRAADGRSALVNERTLRRSFIIAPDTLVEDWPYRDVATLPPVALEPLLALRPELIVLGTGTAQAFPPPATLAACLQRGVGLEAMTNAAAARTYSVLAGEGRRVVAAFVFPQGGH
ncbi:Mth938-like domain-containing protein [Luteimonas sp. 50]|uniref:Mth938-like domain-containing protein n=1 Tax=Cognatiluteimonas sedimenti TaxID=2927791 RepID=A0ABT0A2H4_9GAMM|nr:Mth938-like domain-containing protein [Lysobacter sedimenti]MCJ0825179.1 Mth938-like domain-containing protein [Lysobacter sedimenti]